MEFPLRQWYNVMAGSLSLEDMADRNLALPDVEPARRVKYKVGELFAGAGGMALGVRNAEINGNGFVHVWATDKDEDACRTLKNNLSMCDCRVICSPVEDLDFPGMQAIDGLIFGFPCNDFSVVGDRQGISGRYGGLYRWGVAALKVFRPAFFVAENVGGLKSSGNSKDFDTIMSALARAGYRTFPHMYRFEEYGIPQTRHRMVIVGFRRDLGLVFSHPEPDGKPLATCSEALAEIPTDASNHELTKQSQVVVERLKHIKPGENAFTADLPEHLKLRLKSGAKISQIYKRLMPDAPSYTVTGSGGGGTHVYHWKEHRALTNRERARLQTFPDSFVFVGGKESVRKQIGMAVPPKGAEIVFRAVLRTLLDNDIPACDC